MKFNGVHLHLGNIMKLSDAVTRSITAENIHGEKGGGGRSRPDAPPAGAKALGQDEHQGSIAAARTLGQKCKVRPFISVPPLSTATLADVAGPGVIQHFWITSSAKQYRDLIVRMYWDDESAPSVEVPLADFFCNGWTINLKTFTPVNALPINANPHNGFNCYFPMPFRKHARVTLENRGAEKCDIVAYAINYALTEVEDGDAYFHAQFRRTNPLPFQEDYVILDGVKGRGQYVGTYLAWQQNSSGWWGEGEIKVFLDGGILGDPGRVHRRLPRGGRTVGNPLHRPCGAHHAGGEPLRPCPDQRQADARLFVHCACGLSSGRGRCDGVEQELLSR